MLGHRSQAPPEVRHVSGQHVKEFRDFLAKHSETFVIRGDDDIIYLKKYEGCTSKLGENNKAAPIEITPPKLDPQVTNYLLSTIREHLESSPDETLDVTSLFDQIMPVFEASKCQTMIKRQQDLVTFLKMHSHLFRVNTGMVTLIRNPHQNLPSPTKTKTTLRNDGSPLHHNSNQLQQQSLKQRVNSVVLKVPIRKLHSLMLIVLWSWRLKYLRLRCCSIENQQSPVCVVNCHFFEAS